MMTLEEILETKGFRMSFAGSWERWIPEINWPMDHDIYEPKLKGLLDIYEHLSECEDGRRGRWICSFRWGDKPVMVTIASGRDGCEYEERYIIDRDLYREMLQGIMDIIGPSDEFERDIFQPSHIIEEVYGRPLIREDFDRFYKKEKNLRLKAFGDLFDALVDAKKKS